jgi:predicted nucleic acid-binding protein
MGEFLRVVTHPRVFRPPSDAAVAVGFLDRLLESPSLRVLLPSSRYWELLRALVPAARASGNLIFDAQVAAVCLEHGATTILTEDRDFARFPGITVRTLGG